MKKKLTAVLRPEKIRNLFLYGCDSKADFMLTKDLRRQFDLKVWRIVSGISGLYFAGLFLSTFSITIVQANMLIYLVMFVMMVLGAAALWLKADYKSRWLMPVIYFLAFLLLVFGICIGNVMNSSMLTVTYHVMIVLLPMLIADCPYRIGLLEILTLPLYSAAVCLFKSGETRSMDLYNGIIFAVLGQVVTYYMTSNRMTQFLTTKHMELASITDALTGMLNRKAYEDTIRDPEKEKQENLVYVALDVNGLKAANDLHGHDAGDELLKGAAECIREGFDPYGETFRTGGDEFAVVICASPAELDSIKKKFERLTSSWKGEEVQELSISTGYVTASEMPEASLVDLAREADQRMYEDKARYYARTGKDRRTI